MFCPKCGTKLNNNTNFCSACGAHIETSSGKPMPQTVLTNYQTHYNSSRIHRSSEYHYPTAATSRKNKLKWWHIFLIALAGLIISIPLIAAISKSNSNENQGGFVGNYGNHDDISSTQVSNVINVGSTIKFGTYEQDNNYDNGDEDIEWIVLESDGSKLLLISKYVLDATQYTYAEYGSSWKESAANGYLIDDIYTYAFSYQERKKLTTGTIVTANESFTSDAKVFTLSSEELEKYATIIDGLYNCFPTEYAKDEGIAVSSEEGTTDMAYWWARDDSSFGTVITPSGASWVSTQYDKTKYGVRPAIWVDQNYKTLTDSGASVSADMVGMWETVSGGDDHYIEISSYGKLTVYDGNDKLTVPIVCYSPTEIAVLDGFVFALENGKLVRYDKTGLPDGYIYEKIQG